MSALGEFVVSDAVNYKNGQKNHWRRTMWNCICKFSPDKSLPVIYLPGSADLDSTEAMRRGWDTNNLIAIERSGEIVQQLRRRGRNVIKGDFISVLLNWPDTQPVGVIIADFQSCISKDPILAVSGWLTLKAMERSILMINLQRGREAGPLWQDAKAFSQKVDTDHFRDKMGISHKHRGMLVAMGAFVATMEANFPSKETGVNLKEAAANYVANTGMDWSFPPSYRSTEKSPLFDSVVLARLNKCGALIERSGVAKLYENATVRNRISAALAIRTMRMNGQLSRVS